MRFSTLTRSMFAMGLLALSTSAYAGLDLRSAAMVRNLNLHSHSDAFRLRNAAPALPAVSTAFARIADGHSAADLEEAGMEVLTIIGDIAIVKLPTASAPELANIPAVASMQLQRPLKTDMDVARQTLGVDDILFNNPAAGLPKEYTGKNVIAGIIDQGVDPHHINFRYADGSSRIGYLAWLRMNAAGNGLAENHYNYSNISNFTTDTPYAYHGTHTAGIMTGSYNGPVTVPDADGSLRTVDNRYYGIAPEADVAIACGELFDAVIAYGLQCLVDYSKWEERPWPMVINMSIGSTAGARDKRSLMNRILDEMGKDAIICVSSGNEGDLKLALNRTLTADKKSFKTLIYPYAYPTIEGEDPLETGNFTIRHGSVEVWSEDERPFKLKAVIYNKKRGYRSALNMGVVGDNIGTYYVSSSDYAMTSEDIVGDPSFCKAFDGFVGVGAKLDEDTGRYYGMVDYYVINNASTNLDDNYVLGFEVEGEDGQRIDCYCDGTTTWIDSYGIEGFEDGSTDGTINDMAVADHVLAVGSFNTRNTWPVLNGQTLRYDGDSFRPGYISGFSSYATMPDGTTLPAVCAPGSTVISSVSWPYAQDIPDEEINATCSARLDETDRVNLWKQEVGTSMSSPFVAGTIALWLEANPALTIEDVKDIISRTSTRDEQVESEKEQARWGTGKFNPLAGLKEAIRMAGINGVTPDGNNDRLLLTRDGRRFNLFLGETEEMNVNLYSTESACLFSTSAPGDEIDIDLSGIPAGIYILNVNGRHSKKITL